MCNYCGSGSLPAWHQDARKETPVLGPRRQRCDWFEARRGFQRCRETVAGYHGCPRGRQSMAWPEQPGARGACPSCPRSRPGWIQCTKPEVQITCGTARHAPGQMRPGNPCLHRGVLEMGPPAPAVPLPALLTSNISPMRTQSTKQKPMSAWLWMTNSWLKSG